MNLKRQIISVLLMALLVGLVMLAGCNQNETAETVDLALVVNPTAGNPVHDLTPAEMYVQEACLSYGTVSLITEDGDPLVQRIGFTKPAATEMSGDISLEYLAGEQTRLLLLMADSLRPVTEETDTLEAIARAASAVNAGEGTVKRILIFSSGLSTRGYVSFLEGDITAQSPDEIVSALTERCALPDLTDVEVIWFNVGVTAGEQQPLTAAEKDMLRRIWENILRTAGADVTFCEYPVQPGSRSSHVPVTAVEVGEIVSVIVP